MSTARAAGAATAAVTATVFTVIGCAVATTATRAVLLIVYVTSCCDNAQVIGSCLLASLLTVGCRCLVSC